MTIYIYIYIYVCVYIYIYIHTYTHMLYIFRRRYKGQRKAVVRMGQEPPNNKLYYMI